MTLLRLRLLVLTSGLVTGCVLNPIGEDPGINEETAGPGPEGAAIVDAPAPGDPTDLGGNSPNSDGSVVTTPAASSPVPPAGAPASCDELSSSDPEAPMAAPSPVAVNPTPTPPTPVPSTPENSGPLAPPDGAAGSGPDAGPEVPDGGAEGEEGIPPEGQLFDADAGAPDAAASGSEQTSAPAPTTVPATTSVPVTNTLP